MISKSLFIKLQKEDLKRRIWIPILSVLAFFMALPVVIAIQIGNYSTYLKREEVISNLIELIGPQFEIIILVTIAGAILCGLSGFCYLHSRKKTDLYHSIPVRRETLFAVNYMNGLLIYLIPYAISLLLCFMILGINKYMNGEILVAALSALGINFLFYSLIYTIVVAAVMLTGNLIVSCLGTGVFFFYGPLLMLLKEMYFTEFFKTYNSTVTQNSIYTFLSPLYLYYKFAKLTGRGDANGENSDIIMIVLVTAALIALSLFLYKRRSSEAAGSAMAFPGSRPVIKFLLVIPAGLLGGILFRQVAQRGSEGWFLFGLVISFFLCNGVIEIIYNLDLRCAFNHKKQMLFSGAILLAMVAVFWLDIFHYDTYLPGKDKISYMSVSIFGIDQGLDYIQLDDKGNGNAYTNSDTYQMKNMEIRDFDDAYALAVLGIRHVKDSEEPENYYSCKIKYTLKNGQKVYRNYNLTMEESYDLVKKVYDSKEYKEGHFPLYKINAGDIRIISGFDKMKEITFTLSQEEKKELLDIYRKELGEIALDDIKRNQPVAGISYRLRNDITLNYNVYASFQDTIAFLQKHGFEIDTVNEVQNIKEITVINYQSQDSAVPAEENAEGTSSAKADYRTKTYKTKKEITEILPYIVDSDYLWNYNSIIQSDNSIEVEVVINKDKFGNEAKSSYYFRKNSIPEFVKKDIGYSAG